MIEKLAQKAMKKNNVSQNGLAKLLNMSGAGLSNAIAKNKTSDETLFKLARLAGEDPLDTYTEYKLSNPLKPEDKAVWMKMKKTVEQYILC